MVGFFERIEWYQFQFVKVLNFRVLLEILFRLTLQGTFLFDELELSSEYDMKT